MARTARLFNGCVDMLALRRSSKLVMVMYPLCSSHSPSRDHSKDPQKESIAGNTITLMTLINPQIFRFYVELNRVPRPVYAVAVNIVFLIQQPRNH